MYKCKSVNFWRKLKDVMKINKDGHICWQMTHIIVQKLLSSFFETKKTLINVDLEVREEITGPCLFN